jgi:hypothetical protein
MLAEHETGASEPHENWVSSDQLCMHGAIHHVCVFMHYYLGFMVSSEEEYISCSTHVRCEASPGAS